MDQDLRRGASQCLFLTLLLASVMTGLVAVSGAEPSSNATTNAVSAVKDSTDILRAGERLVIVLTDIPMGPFNYDQNISEDGYITLHLDKRFQAAGKSRSQLQKEIRDAYVPNFYVRMTVTVKQEERFFHVMGQVRAPNRYLYAGETTVLKAIATAGGFASYAKSSEVQVTRAANKQTIIVDCEKAKKNAKLDLPIYPGDFIFVKESPWGIK